MKAAIAVLALLVIVLAWILWELLEVAVGIALGVLVVGLLAAGAIYLKLRRAR